MENPISISNINDFIFCPVSIYFHMLDDGTEQLSYQDAPQINGSAAHASIDAAQYTTRADILQAVSVYSERYGLIGKIDVFDKKNGVLTERKRAIKTVYDGYVFQVYAQYFGLVEMGYTVKRIRLHSITDNRTYEIALPDNDAVMLDKFEKTLAEMRSFEMDEFHQGNSLKCAHCIYEPLCSFSALKEE